MAKSSKRSSSGTSGGKKGAAKSDLSKVEDAIEAEVVSETTPDPEPNTAPEEIDATTSDSKGDAEGGKAADKLPELEPLEETSTAEAEPETEAEPEPDNSDVTDPEPTQAPAQASSGGGIFGSVVGGMIAAAIGFGAAMMIFPQGWRVQDNSALTTLEGTVQDLGATVAEQAGVIDATKSTLEAEVAALTESDSALSAGVEGLANRLAELTQGDGTAKLPGDVQILLNAQKEEIAKLQATVSGMAQDAEERIAAANAQQETAEQAEARVKARGAAQEIRLALLSGEPFAEALDVVAPAVEVPEALTAVAAEGAPTSADVSGAFPAAARAALSKAVRETAGDDTQSRLKLFFQDQLSARSLSPQEGDSADAVLSRAEAAVKAEDYQAALDEIAALPESAQAELADWRAKAEARLGAVNAFTAVTDALNSN